MLLVALVNGGNYSVAKWLIPHFMSAGATVQMRLLAGAFSFWVLDAIFGNKEVPERSDYGWLFLCSILGVTGNQLLFYHGMEFTTPANASILMLVTPMLIVLFSGIVLKRTLARQQVFGMMLGCWGGWMLLHNKNPSYNSSTLKGDFYILANGAFYALYVVLVTKLVTKYRPLMIVKWLFLFGSIMAIPFGLDDLINKTNWQQMETGAILCILYLVFLSTIFIYSMNTYIPSKAGPEMIGAYIYLQPVAAIVIAAISGLERPNAMQILYAVPILLGVYLTTKTCKRNTTVKRAG